MRNAFIRRLLPCLAVICVMISLLSSPITITYAKTSGDIQHIYDEAGLLSSSELNELEDMCAEYSLKDDLDIIILTHDDPNAVDGEIYIENFNDKNRYLDSVILLVDMHNRDVIVQGYGIAESKINSSKAQAITDNIASYLSDGYYYDAFKKYIRSSDKYINEVPIYMNTLVHLGVAIAIGVIAVAIMAYNAGGKMTVNGNNYIDINNSGLIGRRDDYIRTHITRVPKPKNNGGGGGISAGGLSHSSGRSKF